MLRARFNDARFFWDVDQQKKLADRVDDLANVTFQAKLGSYHDKTERTVALVKELGGDADAQRAALLAKCDLTTEMVKEFTELQGIIGGLYAARKARPKRRAGHLRSLQAAEHGGLDSRDARRADLWRWPTSSTRCAAASASAWFPRARRIRSRCAAPRRAS